MKGIIEGLTILAKYVNNEKYNFGAEHDIIYVYEIDRPIDKVDLSRLVELGWFQDEVDYGDGDFTVRHYNPNEGWAFYT